MCDVSGEYLDVLRGWDLFERTHHNVEVVDFDMAPGRATSTRMVSRTEAVVRLNALRGALGDAFDTRLGAHLGFAAALDGHCVPLGEYVAATMGCTPTVIPDRALAERWENLVPRLTAAGWDGVSSPGTILDGVEPEVSAAEYAELINLEFGTLTDELTQLVGTVPRFELDVEVCDIPAEYWSFWVDGYQGRVRLRLNEANASFYAGTARLFCAHELTGHAHQISSWAGNVGAGVLEPWRAVSCVHTDEQVLLEGVGLNMLLFLPGCSPSTETFIDTFEFRQLVAHNSHLLADTDPSTAVEYTHRWAPWVPTDTLARDIYLRRSSPTHRTYLLSYPAGSLLCSAGARSTDPSAFLSWAYTAPRSPSELVSWLSDHNALDTASLPFKLAR